MEQYVKLGVRWSRVVKKATLYIDIKCKTFFHTTFKPLTKSKDNAISIYNSNMFP